jgi:diaminohydroxyphosphoribosylaminopyrimidine deaminase/5-amino-6-(5-phosphoribosylamino)uracil reductase
MENSSLDIKFMQIALACSRKGRGFTGINPMVGAVVVKEQQVVSVGYHKQFGSDHAEVMALKDLDARGATIYISLEPCTHFGNTPPCVDLLIKKKLKRVVIAVEDPNPIVYKKGIEKLRENNIDVEVGVLREQVMDLNRHYFTYFNKNRPFITLKAGVSIDGKLSDKYGESQWVTSEELRRISHSMRGEYSAILAGVNTVLKDNPHLTIRSGKWKNKVFYRIVLDTKNQLSPRLNVFKDQENSPLMIFSSNRSEKKKKTDLHFFIDEVKGKLNLSSILNKLYELKISSVLVEGGGRVISSFLEEKLFDEMVLFNSGSLLGGQDSVELFHEGKRISESIYLKDRKVYNLSSGYIIRGMA